MNDEFRVLCDKIAVRGMANWGTVSAPEHPENIHNRVIHERMAKEALKHVKFFGSALKTDLWNEIVQNDVSAYSLLKSMGFNVHFLEMSDVLVHFGREKIADATIKQGDIRNMPYPDNSFDFIADFSTSDHFPDFQNAISEHYRTLKPDGVLLIFIAYRSWYSKKRGYGADQFGDIYGNVQYYFPLEEIKKALSKFKKIKDRYGYTIHNFKIVRKACKQLPFLLNVLMFTERHVNMKALGYQYIFIGRKETVEK
jgi:SAM-dependent methyltransferase